MPYELLVSDPKLIKGIKTRLESRKGFVKPIYEEGEYKVIRTNVTSYDDPILEGFLKREYKENEVIDEICGIVGFTRAFLQKLDVDNVEELIECLPLRYSIYKPLVLFNYSKQKSFDHALWKEFFKNVGDQIKKEYFKDMLSQVFPSGMTHIAINMPIIESDVMRRPFNIAPLYGELISSQVELTDELWDHPKSEDFNSTVWCHTIQNGIHQFWAPMFTMFSRGNIKEKKRVIDTFKDIEGNDVVDLYAGIGYFTLSYLKRGARTVFGFELNPWSVEALRRGLKANNITDGKCLVYNESNEKCLQRIQEARIPNLRVRHINLGLLPSSKPGWSLAIRIISLCDAPMLVTLHIHENVHIEAIRDGSFVRHTLQQLTEIDKSYSYHATHVEKIKTFAPDVWHICLDVDVKRSATLCI